MTTITDPTWPKMVDILPEQEHGEVRIEHYEITEMDAAMNFHRRMNLDPGRHCRLFVGKEMMMSDTRDERSDCRYPVWKGNGRMLIAGLGLGWMIHPIMEKGEVTHLTIVEKSADVIAVVGPTLEQYGDRIEIVHADIFDWQPPKGVKYDTIWFDIWADICGDNLPEYTKLNRRFARRLNRDNPKAWRGAWKEQHLRWCERTGNWR